MEMKQVVLLQQSSDDKLRNLCIDLMNTWTHYSDTDCIFPIEHSVVFQNHVMS